MLCFGCLTISTNVLADIVWSGEQNLGGDFQYIDLNFDSRVDVNLDYSVAGDLSVEHGRIGAYVDGPDVDGSNRILVNSTNGVYAALPHGLLISGTPGHSMDWGEGTYFSGTVSSWSVYNPDFPGPPLESDEEWRGLLGENGNTYFGIEFDIAGNTHYGWVNIALGPEGYLGFRDPITTSWAYESTPNTGIVAGAIPEPSTGILTTIGSVSLLYIARARRRGKFNHTSIPKHRKTEPSACSEEW